MNIFFLSQDSSECARSHVDKHVVKMVTEQMQILSTAHRVLDGIETIGTSKSGRKQKIWVLPDERDAVIYKATHVNHPSMKWCRHSKANYDWLYSMTLELLREYTHRYGKHHACERLIPALLNAPMNIQRELLFSPPWRAMPDEFKVPKSDPDYCVKSYRAYYLGSKTHLFSWKNRETPEWISGVNN